VVSVATAPEAPPAFFALERGAPALTPIPLVLDPGGPRDSAQGDIRLSPDGRWFLFRNAGQQRVRDLRTSAEHAIDGTLGRVHVVGFAHDSSALLFEDVTAFWDGTTEAADSVYRILALDTGETYAVRLELVYERPVALESSRVLFVVNEPDTESEGEERKAELLRVYVEGDGLRRTLLATSSLSENYGRVSTTTRGMAWVGQNAISLADRDGRNRRDLPATVMGSISFSPSGDAVAYVGIAPLRVEDLSALQRLPAQVNYLTTRDGAERAVHVCRGGCVCVFEDATHLLVQDGSDLLRVSLDGEVTHLMSGVLRVSFDGNAHSRDGG
jgi:hypothetical protein